LARYASPYVSIKRLNASFLNPKLPHHIIQTLATLLKANARRFRTLNNLCHFVAILSDFLNTRV
jgi:hypothetical protein